VTSRQRLQLQIQGDNRTTFWQIAEIVKFQLTNHARKAVAEREIPIEWIERTLDTPELIVPDPNDPTIERCFRQIPEFGGRVLRVAVNRAVEPKRVVSVFFDRKMKGKL
jgi:Domain of unknown function (DUF4258)